jgi:GT2 family glycosyltransferase
VVCNNDIVFVQKNFIDELLKLYEVSQFYIAGPDIYNTAENIHQNPFDYKIATLDYVEKRIKNVKTELNNLDLYMKKDLFIKKISDLCIYKLIHRARHKQETRQMETVCIHGACIIVSEKFIAQSEGLFVPETKFYCEEEILSYRCYKKGWKIIYSPAIIVEHRESVATSEKYSNYRSRREFMLKSTLDSLQILKNYVINTR